MSMRSLIEEKFGIHIVQRVKVRDVYKLIARNRSYCLKGYAVSEEEVRFLARIFTFLEQRGFNRGQRLYPTLQQTPYITRGNVHYMLTNWVEGRNPNFKQKADFKKAIRTLAKFHSAAEGFPIAEAPAGRVRYSTKRSDLSEYIAILGKYKSTTHLVPLCEQVIESFNRPRVIQAMEAEQRAGAFVHGDYNYPNLVKDTERKLHLIDFENSSLNIRMQDLSHILHRNFLWNGKEMLGWIDYYERKRPLSKQDLHLLHALLSAPYHVIRNIKIAGIRHARSVIPTRGQLKMYLNELKSLL